jgi:hypothetical protein
MGRQCLRRCVLGETKKLKLTFENSCIVRKEAFISYTLIICFYEPAAMRNDIALVAAEKV